MKRKVSWISTPQFVVILVFILAYSLVADIACNERHHSFAESDSLSAVAEYDSTLKAYREDSIRLALEADTVFGKKDTVTSVFTFSFSANAGKFHHPRLGHIHIYPEELDTTNLVPMDLSTAMSVLKLQQNLEYYKKGSYFYYSIEDTSRKGYKVVTLLHYRGEEDAGIYLVFIGNDGKHIDSFEAAQFNQTDRNNTDGPAASIGFADFVEGNRMTGDDYYTSPISPYEEVYDSRGRKAVSKIVHYQFQFSIDEDGTVTQESMTENDVLLQVLSDKYRKLLHLSPVE